MPRGKPGHSASSRDSRGKRQYSHMQRDIPDAVVHLRRPRERRIPRGKTPHGNDTPARLEISESDSADEHSHRRARIHPAEIPSASLIERAFDYINRHIRQKITVSDIVKTLGISQRLVELRFKEQLGVSLVQTILAQRLEYLRKELLQSSQPASAVAAACGFSDMAYLTRVFKRRFGTTPAACRRLKLDNIS